MAVGIASGEAQKILDALGNATNYTAPTAFWLQLHTADPGAAGTTAIAGNATRKQVSFGAASGPAIANDTAIVWTAGEVDTAEDYTHWSAWSASSGGTFLHSGLVTANAVLVGDTFTIPIGDVDLTITGVAA
jgi:hypothetical protein